MNLRYLYRVWGRTLFKVIICLALSLFLANTFQLLDFSKRRYYTWSWDRSCHGVSPFDKACTASRASIAPDVQIVVETGGSEPQSRLLYQLTTMLSKVPRQNILIFSDMDENIEHFHIHDALADVSTQERKDYPEFAFYDELHAHQQLGKDTRQLEGGWKLAKYKNMAAKRKIWRMLSESSNPLPKRKWYVFIDTDTFVEWDNLLALLEHLNPLKNMYIGSPVWVPDAPFAHGGSAYVLSYSALESLNMPARSDGREESLYSQFGVNTTALCCGDEALALALKQRRIGLRGYWPMFNGDIPATIGFGREIWCEPVISMHHLAGPDMQDLWQWIEDWKFRTMSTPFLFEDLFAYVAPQLVRRRSDWDNTEEGWKIYYRGNNKDSSMTFEECEAACEADRLCFQFVSHGNSCALSHTIRIGRKQESEDGYPFISGWNLERIKQWTAETKCSSAHWLHSNP